MVFRMLTVLFLMLPHLLASAISIHANQDDKKLNLYAVYDNSERSIILSIDGGSENTFQCGGSQVSYTSTSKFWEGSRAVGRQMAMNFALGKLTVGSQNDYKASRDSVIVRCEDSRIILDVGEAIEIVRKE
jgi:hypothetical protein